MRTWMPLALLLAAVGCTHTQLRNNTLGQVHTLADLHQQQVLDNLAMFIHNPEALPYFAYPDSGQNQLTDTAGVGSTITWNAGGFDSANVNPTTLRQASEVWTLHPINDPHKLTLMRCAYQKALESSGLAQASACCPDCDARLRDFYKGHPPGGEGESGVQQELCCLNFAPGWFRYGRKCDVPCDCCGYVGHYCGVYVWVPPAGRREFTKLTLAILDFALYDPHEPEQETKEVTLWLDAAGNPATQDRAVKQIVAEVPVNAAIKTKEDVEKLLIQGGGPAVYHRKRRTDHPHLNEGLLELRRRLEAIH
jgi:hypothetical protein